MNARVVTLAAGLMMLLATVTGIRAEEEPSSAYGPDISVYRWGNGILVPQDPNVPQPPQTAPEDTYVAPEAPEIISENPVQTDFEKMDGYEPGDVETRDPADQGKFVVPPLEDRERNLENRRH